MDLLLRSGDRARQRNPLQEIRMLIDKRTQFSADGGSAVVTTGNTTTVLPSTIPLSQLRNLGAGEAPRIKITNRTAILANTGTPTTFSVAVRTAATDGAMSSGTVLIQGKSWAVDNVTGIPAGTTILDAVLPARPDDYNLFLGVTYRNETANALAAGGLIEAYVQIETGVWKAYPSATGVAP